MAPDIDIHPRMGQQLQQQVLPATPRRYMEWGRPPARVDVGPSAQEEAGDGHKASATQRYTPTSIYRIVMRSSLKQQVHRL